MRWLLVHFLFAGTALGCVSDADVVTTDEITAPDDDGKADAATELRVRVGETSVWITRALTRVGPNYVLRGRASRTITDGLGWIWDDPYGDYASRGPRSFELTWSVGSARGLMDGIDQFLRLTFVPSAGRPDVLSTKMVMRPRLASTSGSSNIYLTAELTPVIVAGHTVYRLKGHTFTPVGEVRASAADGSAITARRLDPTHFELDLEPEQVIGLAGVTGANLTVTVRGNDGSGDQQRRASLGLALKTLGLTIGADVEPVWPALTCAAATRTCLAGPPDGTLDTSTCGAAVPVRACRRELGVTIDPALLDATRADVATRLAAPAFRADAAGVVGADRADAWQAITTDLVDERLDALAGRWLLTESARTAVLATAVDDGLDEAYALPLPYFMPRPPAPGNPAATRQLVADGLLTYLSEQDFLHTEFNRSLTELAHEFRTWHVASLLSFRETIAAEPHYANPNWDVYLGNWLDAYTEVSVDRATGVVTHVMVEID